MADNKYIPWYDSYYDRLAKLSDQEVGRLVRALMIYHRTGEAQELTGRESVAYDFIVVDIDQAEEALNEREKDFRVARKEAGRLGGLAKASKYSKSKQNVANVANVASATVPAPPLVPPCPSPSSSPPHPPISYPSPNPPIIPPSPDDETRTRAAWGPAIPTDSRISIVFTAYAERIGLASPMTERIRDQLLVFLDTMGPDCCIRAMDEAVEAGKISWKYVKGILEKKREQGVRSIVDWEKSEEAHSGKKRAVQHPSDFQPDAGRIRKNNEWLDEFLAEQEGKGGGEP